MRSVLLTLLMRPEFYRIVVSSKSMTFNHVRSFGVCPQVQSGEEARDQAQNLKRGVFSSRIGL